jgi:hypothetical protein
MILSWGCASDLALTQVTALSRTHARRRLDHSIFHQLGSQWVRRNTTRANRRSDTKFISPITILNKCVLPLHWGLGLLLITGQGATQPPSYDSPWGRRVPVLSPSTAADLELRRTAVKLPACTENSRRRLRH